eukprot:4571373-Ditylum_brightwellii.AAC.1
MVSPVKMGRKEEDKSDYSSANDDGTYDDDVNGHDAVSLRLHAITDNNQPNSGCVNYGRGEENETK